MHLNRGIACDFTSSSAVFQSYQDDGRVIIKDVCAMESRLRSKRSLPRARLDPRAVRSVDQRLTY